MCDIDVDFQAERRDDVKEYITKLYGEENVCSVGSFTRMALKGSMKDLNRVIGDVDFNKMNFITKGIPNEVEYSFEDLFKSALNNREVYEFVQKYPDIVHAIKSTLNQCRASSIHASAVVILPDKDEGGNPMKIWDWIPVRTETSRDGQKVLVSEWEGKMIDKSGFLKEDILGLKLLDKFKFIITEIKKNHNKTIVLEDIPLDDENVYHIFQRGFNEDIFQFGSPGIKAYSKIVKPDCIEDMIAMNALYRPGAMGSGAHMKFAEIKHGKKNPEYDYGLKEVTKNTFGLFTYQEQIMSAMNVLGGFTLVESDTVRTIIKKKDKDKMKTYELKFIEGAIKNGCPEEEALKIWNKMFAFSSYAFNKSHSAAYSIMAYWGQWLKCYYPLEFYTTALIYAKTGKEDQDINNILSEIKQRKLEIEVWKPNINYADKIFTTDKKNGIIYWSISNVKNIGDVLVNAIVGERRENGKFQSMEEFITRMKGKRVSCRIVESLINAGAFDELEGLKKPKGRYRLLQRLFSFYKNDLPAIYDNKKYANNYSWISLQKEYSGFGEIDLYKLIRVKNSELARIWISNQKFISTKVVIRKCSIVGKVIKVVERKYGAGKKKKMLSLNVLINQDTFRVTVWYECFMKYNELIREAFKDELLLIFTGKVERNSYDNNNQMQCDEFSKIIKI